MAQTNGIKGMVAYRYHPNSTESIREVIPIPKPGPSEVLVKILAAGLCHSDLSFLAPEVELGGWSHVFTMGHEGAGVIAELGSAIPETYPELKVDTYVAILFGNSCFEKTCVECSTGRDNLCRVIRPYGIGDDGTWASYCIVRAESAFPIPGDIHSIPPPIAAIATDAMLTPYHALKTCIRVKPHQTVLVMGCGGLGSNAIQIAKNCLGVKRVIGCDVRDLSLDIARSVGADFATKPEELPQLIEANNLHIDVVIDFVGNQGSFDVAMGVIGGGGIINIVGLLGKTIEFPLVGAAIKDVTIKSS